MTDFIELDADDTFGMVGNFIPIRRAAEKKTKKFTFLRMAGKGRMKLIQMKTSLFTCRNAVLLLRQQAL